MRRLEVVVGAQFGSEAKGHVVQRLTERAVRENRHPQVVRVAGPNAGHTGYDASGRAWALRQVPVAAVVGGPVVLGVAAGSEIDPPVLLDEYDRLRDAGLMKDKMLWVHSEATLITDRHKQMEAGGLVRDRVAQEVYPDLVKEIGSTGKGIGAARSDRVMRGAKRVTDSIEFLDQLANRGIPVAHHSNVVTDTMDPDGTLIIEGTQGYGLGLHAGFYPQCTSSDCRAIDFMAMAGVHSHQFETTEVWAVARMFPIRVAGNSGPLKGETTWEALGLPEERTTVTKKVRRVGAPDWDLVRRAVRANGGAPTVRLAITMVDQMFPFLKDEHIPMDFEKFDGDQRSAVSWYFKDVERQTNAQIGMVTTGPNTASFL